MIMYCFLLSQERNDRSVPRYVFRTCIALEKYESIPTAQSARGSKSLMYKSSTSLSYLGSISTLAACENIDFQKAEVTSGVTIVLFS